MAKIDNEYVTIFTDIDGTLIEQLKFEDLDPTKQMFYQVLERK